MTKSSAPAPSPEAAFNYQLGQVILPILSSIAQSQAGMRTDMNWAHCRLGNTIQARFQAFYMLENLI